MLLRRLRKPVAVLLTAALLSCAGCGTNEAEKVTGYGGGTGTSESPEKKDTEATSKTSQEATENNSECTYLPVWYASVYSNDSYALGILIQNAVDGSFVKILYN